MRPTGGRVELLLLGRLEGDATAQRWRALGHASKRLTIGSRVVLAEGRLEALVEGRSDDPGRAILEVRLSSRGTEAIDELLRRYGTLPLPPYIEHVPDAADEDRYQTLFAREPGAVAAPTAGLHFSETLMADMRAAGHEFAAVTLHVGLGTFAPIRAARLEDHVMHRERFRVPPETARAIGEAQSAQHPVVAIGTTVVRSLESAVQEDGRVVAIEGEASLFIRPPYRFRAFDHLLTNFHLPRSTLLALVMAFGGIELVREAYRVAVDAEYRFFSYGDAMLVL